MCFPAALEVTDSAVVYLSPIRQHLLSVSGPGNGQLISELCDWLPRLLLLLLLLSWRRAQKSSWPCSAERASASQVGRRPPPPAPPSYLALIRPAAVFVCDTWGLPGHARTHIPASHPGPLSHTAFISPLSSLLLSLPLTLLLLSPASSNSPLFS